MVQIYLWLMMMTLIYWTEAYIL